MRLLPPKPAENWPDDIILFDGVCLFCSRWVRAVMARDGGRFRFVSIQSPYGTAMARAFGLDPQAPDSNAVVIGGRAFFKSDAALGVLGALPGWGWASVLRLVPRLIRDPAYDVLARHRYRLFGKAETCFAPTSEQRARFLDDVAPPSAPPSAPSSAPAA